MAYDAIHSEYRPRPGAIPVRGPEPERTFVSIFDTDVPPDLLASADTVDALRTLSDLPTQLRLHSVRTVGFLGVALITSDAAQRDACIAGMHRAIAGIDTVVALLRAGGADPALHLEVIAVLGELRGKGDRLVPSIVELRDRALGCERLLQEGAEARPSFEATAAHLNGPYVNTILDFTEAMKRIVAARRAAAAARARAAQAAALEACDRIADIARTVRLISLNARVEAARAGDAGRAFGVIAEEIKTLSEQTEVASAEMGGSIGTIMQHMRAG